MFYLKIEGWKREAYKYLQPQPDQYFPDKQGHYAGYQSKEARDKAVARFGDKLTTWES